jgi:DNA repair protein RAD7
VTRSTAAASATEAGPSTSVSSARKKSRKRKRLVDEEDDNDWTSVAGRVPRPGQISFCAECDCRFTVTAYHRPGPGGEGLLCNTCGAQDAKAHKAAKRKTAQSKRAKKGTAQRILDRKEGGPKSLRELCINVRISAHFYHILDTNRVHRYQCLDYFLKSELINCPSLLQNTSMTWKHWAMLVR